MRYLWFKQIYVEEILNGSKCDTIRKKSSRLPSVGDVVACSVGPRAAFATVLITSVEPIEKVAGKRGKAVAELYGDDADLVKICFTLVQK